MTEHFDAIVLGAGIVGVSTALHLQARGRSVTLLDRRAPGTETSLGNAGLTERCIGEHERFVGSAGVATLMRRDGWIVLHRSHRAFEQTIRRAGDLTEFSLDYDILDEPDLKRREPTLRGEVAGTVHWRDPVTVSGPGRVTRAYADLFAARGGRMVTGDAQALAEEKQSWRLGDHEGECRARDLVVALGPWSAELCQRFGYRFPIAYKRGYHMHYDVQDETSLHRPLCDAEAGFVLAPMARGIRLTTGVELADRDAPSDARQLAQAERIARRIFPLGAAIDPSPWRSARLCLPDMKLIIGEAPRHDGLWFAFGHAHHGFTLGPVAGRLLAELMTGDEAFTDRLPYAPARYLT